jgi:hypothetical protein
MRAYGLALVATALLVPACAKQRGAARTPDEVAFEQQYYDDDYYKRPSPGNPPGTDTLPGTTRAVRPSQGTFSRSSIPPTPHQLEQGVVERDLSTTRAIREAMAQHPGLPHDGGAVTVITHDGQTVLLGRVQSEAEREAAETIARQHSDNVESHIEVGVPSQPAPTP